MILSAHQPCYLPWLGYIDKLSMCDVFVFMDDVMFSKNSFYARNKIKTNIGITSWLTVPTKKGSTNQLIKDVLIAGKDWKQKHWLKIKRAYEHSCYFKDYEKFFKELYSQNWKYLADLNKAILNQIIVWFGLKTEVVRASDYDFYGLKSERLLSYCEKFGANHYVFGRNGKDYADQDLFHNRNVSISFQEYTHPVYPQMFGEFIPHLSFVDYMFNCGNNK